MLKIIKKDFFFKRYTQLDLKVSFIPVKGSHNFDIKNTNRHYADPLNPQKKLDKYLSFTNGDFRVAAVPESISLLHSYLCM